MKPYYFKSEQGNVGDDINAWLWQELIPQAIDNNPDHLLVGIGTLLNHRIPKASKYTVISSGVGYGDQPQLSHGIWQFIGVRGPISKKQLGIQSDISLLDGAYLLPQLRKMPSNSGTNIGYIPHVDSIIHGNWESVCKAADITLIDPRSSIEDFLISLSHCQFVITEAMHGAIISDAYGIPWIPAKAHDHIDERKWLDWSLSVETTIDFNYLNPVWKNSDTSSTVYAKNKIKRTKIVKRIFGQLYTPAPEIGSSNEVINLTAKKLKKIAAEVKPKLSSRSLISDKTERLNNDIDKFMSA